MYKARIVDLKLYSTKGENESKCNTSMEQFTIFFRGKISPNIHPLKHSTPRPLETKSQLSVYIYTITIIICIIYTFTHTPVQCSHSC